MNGESVILIAPIIGGGIIKKPEISSPKDDKKTATIVLATILPILAILAFAIGGVLYYRHKKRKVNIQFQEIAKKHHEEI